MDFRYFRKLLSLVILMLLVSLTLSAQGPGCGCDELDPLSPEYDDCVANCGEVVIPVNGNLWIPIISAIALAFYKLEDKRGVNVNPE